MGYGADVTDEELMRRVAGRDAQAFRALADRYMVRAVGFAERLIGSRSLAEDVAQEAFAAVWTQAPRWKPTAKFSTWLHRVLGNLASHPFRDRLHDHAPLDAALADGGPGTEETVFLRQRREAVREALLALAPRQRLAVVLCHYEGFNQREACAVMEIGEGALESLLSRGRAQLRARLAPQFLQ